MVHLTRKEQLLVISSKVTANDLVAPTACLEAINWLRWAPPVLLFCVYWEVVKLQYTSRMKVGTGGTLGLSREYHKQLFGPLFYTWWNCPLNETQWPSGSVLCWRSRDRGFEPCRRLLWSVLGQDSLVLIASSVREGRKMEVFCAGRIIPCACKRTYVIFRLRVGGNPDHMVPIPNLYSATILKQ